MREECWKKILFLPGYHKDEIIINTNTIFIRYLFVDFKTVTLCSIDSIRSMKYVFSAKIQFMKTSIKTESRVVNLNPDKDEEGGR